jgi:pimeloyl-ACP methyl ester carboxylesterase
MNFETSFLTLPDRKLAYQQWCDSANASQKKAVIFLSGYASDMTGTKACFLAERCAEARHDYLRFDYRGHGQSSGAFTDGTIGAWFDDALTVFDRLTKGPQILVGSSMGGWIALLLARARPERVAGFVGIAAAPDFTDEIVVPVLTPSQREQLAREGLTYDENAPPDFRVPITQRFIEESRQHLLLGEPIPLNAPAHLLQGQMDKEVPWQYVLRIADRLTGQNVRVTLVKDADHRLSRPEDLALLWQAVQSLF